MCIRMLRIIATDCIAGADPNFLSSYFYNITYLDSQARSGKDHLPNYKNCNYIQTQ